MLVVLVLVIAGSMIAWNVFIQKPKQEAQEKARLEQLQQTHPELYQLWVLRQRLHDWYEIDTTPQLAQVSLQTWIEDATALGLTQLDKFCADLAKIIKKLS